MKLIIAGSRTFNDYALLNVEVHKVIKRYLDEADAQEPLYIISGGARGVDKLGERWALSNGHALIRMPANWDMYGKSAGYRRNEEMARVATHCLVFWDGQSRGSKHMIDLAQKYKLKTTVVRYIPEPL